MQQTCSWMSRWIVRVIRWYQRKAPEKLRNSCRFQPSCSNYTIIALEKYGTVIGTVKGISRLLRCRAPYGGIDVP